MKRMSSLFRNVDCVSLYVDNLDDGLAFYQEKLGLKLLWRAKNSLGLGMDEDKTEVVLVDEHNPSANFYVEDVEKASEKIVEAGGKITYGPFDIDIGKCCVIQDPWKNTYCILDMSKGKYCVDEKGNVTGLKKS
jgi:lactoylglutathione lyase